MGKKLQIKHEGAVLLCRRMLRSEAILQRCLPSGREPSVSAQKMWIHRFPEATAGSFSCALSSEQRVTACVHVHSATEICMLVLTAWRLYLVQFTVLHAAQPGKEGEDGGRCRCSARGPPAERPHAKRADLRQSGAAIHSPSQPGMRLPCLTASS